MRERYRKIILPKLKAMESSKTPQTTDKSADLLETQEISEIEYDEDEEETAMEEAEEGIRKDNNKMEEEDEVPKDNKDRAGTAKAIVRRQSETLGVSQAVVFHALIIHSGNVAEAKKYLETFGSNAFFFLSHSDIRNR
jgi:hypothetical protein